MYLKKKILHTAIFGFNRIIRKIFTLIIQLSGIGTNPSDFELGDPISLDLQPLSTTVDIMLDLQVITQGACIERKVLVPEPEPVPEPASEDKPRVERPCEDKSRKFICINRIKIERLNDDQNLDDHRCVDSFTYNHELKIQNECIKTSIVSKKISNQNNEDSKQIFNCRIEKIKPKNEDTNSKRLSKSISTCTDDLLDQNCVGSYSKYQLLSSDSLHKCSSTLVDSSTSFENMETKKVEELTPETDKEEPSVETHDALECLNIPLNVKISNKTKPTQRKNESDDEIDIKIPVESDNGCLKRSTEWSIFKNIQENLPKNFHLKSETMSMFSTLTNTRETLHKTTICKN